MLESELKQDVYGEGRWAGVLSVGNDATQRKQTRRVKLLPHLDSPQPLLFDSVWLTQETLMAALTAKREQAGLFCSVTVAH